MHDASVVEPQQLTVDQGEQMKRLTQESFGVLMLLAVGAIMSAIMFVPRAVVAQDSTKTEKPLKVEKVRRGGAYLILESEIQAAASENAFELVQQLRPSMLRGRAANVSSDGGSGGIVVYVDNVRFGGTESLRNVTRIAIREIRFVNAGDATQLFGTGHPSGAILISTKR